MEGVKNNFRNLKVAIKFRGMIAKKNREVVLEASLNVYRGSGIDDQRLALYQVAEWAG
jgi:hypothetical protein